MTLFDHSAEGMLVCLRLGLALGTVPASIPFPGTDDSDEVNAAGERLGVGVSDSDAAAIQKQRENPG